jgi:hypothetical protein
MSCRLACSCNEKLQSPRMHNHEIADHMISFRTTSHFAPEDNVTFVLDDFITCIAGCCWKFPISDEHFSSLSWTPWTSLGDLYSLLGGPSGPFANKQAIWKHGTTDQGLSLEYAGTHFCTTVWCQLCGAHYIGLTLDKALIQVGAWRLKYDSKHSTNTSITLSFSVVHYICFHHCFSTISSKAPNPND